MDRSRKTEIVDERLFETLKQIHDEYNGDIQFESDSNFNTGKIVIKIKD